MRHNPIFVIAAFLLMQPASHAASVQTLGFGLNFAELSGDGQSFAFTADADNATGFGHPSLWNRQSGVLRLELPSGVTQGIVRAMSKDGSTIVGEVRVQDESHLYVWREGVGIDLGPAQLSNANRARTTISDDGSRFLTNQGGGVTDWKIDSTSATYVPQLVNGLRSFAVLSGDGLSIVGRSSDSDDGWRRVQFDGQQIELGTVPSGFTTPLPIASSNDGSTVVGGFFNAPEAWKWDAQSGFQLLPFDAPNSGRWIDMTADGSSVVFGFPPRIWNSEYGTRYLEDVLSEKGVDLQLDFMNHSIASSISDNGLYVLGDVDTVTEPTFWYAYLGVGQTLGDTDNDGDVDLSDLNNVRNNFGGTGLGDTEGNGTVDLADLNNVRKHFGESVPAINAVPEPTSFALLTLCAATAAIGLRPRRQ